MKSTSIFRTGCGTGCALLLMSFGANAGTVTLDTNTYNFQLAGGGGGALATLNGVPVQIFCDNFDDEIWVPGEYSADLTTLGTGANLDETRFGEVSSWTAISTLGASDDSFFNSGAGSTGLARYEMVAYLVSQYNLSQGGNTANNQIQEAIWTIMDPAAEGAVINPSGVDPTSELEQAVTWYTSMNTNQSALNGFLSQFEVVSDPSMTFSNNLGVGGFQEQIVMTPTPEPRGAIWLLLSLLVGGFAVARWNRTESGASSVSQ